MARKRTIGAVIVALFVGACAGSLPPLTPAQVGWANAQWPGTDAAALDSDRSLYVARCAGCHAVVPPERHTADEWDRYLDKMGPRAHLTPSEREDIRRYLLAAIRAPTAP